MLIPRNLEVNGAREKNNKYQCDIFEAFIAALYYDSCKIKYSDIKSRSDLIIMDRGYAFSLCFKFVTSLIEDEIDLTILLETESNHKDELLQTFHKLNWGDPKYNLMETIINNDRMGKKYFKMYVRDIDGNIIGIGIGSSKQKGEKIAAKKALQHLKIIPSCNEDIILPSSSEEIYYKDGYSFFKKNKHSSHNSDNSYLSDCSDETFCSNETNILNRSFDSNNSVDSNNSGDSNNSVDSNNSGISDDSDETNNSDNSDETNNIGKKDNSDNSNILSKYNYTNKKLINKCPELTLADKIKLSNQSRNNYGIMKKSKEQDVNPWILKKK
jgi:hypothetical protein